MPGEWRSFERYSAQCGLCTPGILMTMHALLLAEPDAAEERVRDVLAVLEAREAYSRPESLL